MKDTRKLKSYSETFKQQVVSEVDTGTYSKNEIVKIYGIGPATLYRWIRKYGKFELFNKRVRIETMDDLDQIKQLEKEIKELKATLAKREVDHFKTECYLQVAMDKLGVKDRNAFEKKADAKHSKKG